jgi:uncharacterized protein (TIGR02996 family)
MTERDFLRAIKARPDDDLLRRVFADWLEENGQPERAELIRLQLDREGLPPGHPDQVPRTIRTIRRIAEPSGNHVYPWGVPAG